jgi:hypothetical protein
VSSASASGDGGQISISAGDAGSVFSAANLNVTAGGRGGAITVTARQVEIYAGTLDASGDRGGGLIRLGGDYQGKGSIPNARTLAVQRAVRIRADARKSGDGGRVILWSDEHTRFFGDISARGGVLGGNGGFAEVSGKEVLQYDGTADLRAPQGKGGTLLLDPKFINIVSGGSASPDLLFGINPSGTSTIAGSTITTTLNGGTDVILQANTDITVNDNISGNGSANLTLQAGRSIIVNNNRTITLNSGNFNATVNDTDAVSLFRDSGRPSSRCCRAAALPPVARSTLRAETSAARSLGRC